MISLLITLVVVGFILYLFNTLVPMDARIKTVLNAVVLVCVFLYILQAFGFLTGLGPVGHFPKG